MEEWLEEKDVAVDDCVIVVASVTDRRDIERDVEVFIVFLLVIGFA